MCGDVHAANAPGTSGVPARHANATPGSLEEKVNVGVAVVVVPDGPPVIVTAGPTVSTVNARAVTGPGFSAMSVALTSNVCAPSSTGSVA